MFQFFGGFQGGKRWRCRKRRCSTNSPEMRKDGRERKKTWNFKFSIFSYLPAALKSAKNIAKKNKKEKRKLELNHTNPFTTALKSLSWYPTVEMTWNRSTATRETPLLHVENCLKICWNAVLRRGYTGREPRTIIAMGMNIYVRTWNLFFSSNKRNGYVNVRGSSGFIHAKHSSDYHHVKWKIKKPRKTAEREDE